MRIVFGKCQTKPGMRKVGIWLRHDHQQYDQQQDLCCEKNILCHRQDQQLLVLKIMRRIRNVIIMIMNKILNVSIISITFFKNMCNVIIMNSNNMTSMLLIRLNSSKTHLKVPSSKGVPTGPKMTADLTKFRCNVDKWVEDH